MKNKQGKILENETLGIIIGVLCLVVLIFLGVKLFNLFKKTDVEQAKASLERISSELSSIEKGEKVEADFFIESPNGWYVVSFSNEDSEKPLQCSGDFCLCICDEDDCGGRVVCKPTSKKIKTFEDDDEKSVEIKGITPLKIKLVNGEIAIKKVGEK